MCCGKPAFVASFIFFYLFSFSAHSEKAVGADRNAALRNRPIDTAQARVHSPLPVHDEAAATHGPTALPLPRLPTNDEVCADTTRMTVHQENARWTRATTFQRVAGRRIVASDVLTAKPPLRCHANPPECDTLPP
jgi:hypothetical protein